MKNETGGASGPVFTSREVVYKESEWGLEKLTFCLTNLLCFTKKLMLEILKHIRFYVRYYSTNKPLIVFIYVGIYK